MSHEPSPDEPEGGADGTAWLDDAGSVEPELLDCPVGDIGVVVPDDLEGVKSLEGS